MTILSVAGAAACKNNKTFTIDFCGQDFAFTEPSRMSKEESIKNKIDPWLAERGMMPARKEHKAGELVVLYYPMVATDTDYRFILDGVEVSTDYEHSKGYIIRFTMPEHDVTLKCRHRNSMLETPGEWEE